MKEILIQTSPHSDKDGNSSTCVLLCNNGKLIEYYEDKENKERLEGNIYLGKIQKVLPGIQAAFIDIGEKKNAFIHYKDALPKRDVTSCKENINSIPKIENYIREGQKILVQIKRDATMRKGPRVTTHINIGNRFIALLPNTPFVTVSQKIENELERKRLKQIVEEYLPKKYGAIVRTAAEGKTKQEIVQDIDDTLKIWKEINKKLENNFNEPIKIYERNSLVTQFLIDVLDQGIERIWVSDQKTWQEVMKLLQKMNKSNNVEVKQKEDILDMYDLKEQIAKKEERKVWLKCGGFITIDSTEALVAIDVNSGKYVGKDNLEKTVLRVNKEASIEIAKQLRLRDIGGIVVIDYIDMTEEKDREEIIKTLQENLKHDRSKTQIIGFTKLNLLELTRKHICS